MYSILMQGSVSESRPESGGGLGVRGFGVRSLSKGMRMVLSCRHAPSCDRNASQHILSRYLDMLIRWLATLI